MTNDEEKAEGLNALIQDQTPELEDRYRKNEHLIIQRVTVACYTT